MSESLLLQFPESTALDTYISNSNPSSNFSNANNIKFGVDTSGFITRALFKPLFSTVPTNSFLEKAEIRLFCIAGGSGTYDLHELNNFSEIATWNSYSNTSNYNTTPFTTLTNFTFVQNTWYTFDFLILARQWLMGTRNNNGILFKAKSSTQTGSMATFASSSYVDNWLRPQIYYEYRPNPKKNNNALLNNNYIGGVISC